MPVGFTDHSLVLCHVVMKNVLPRRAYWHFNSVLTFDKGFKEALSYFWAIFDKGKMILNVLGSGGTMVKLR